jgi:hypothetical protein
VKGWGSRFVAVPADRLLAELRDIGARVVEAGGTFVEGRQGREILFDVGPRGSKAVVRVYTSLALGAKEVRDCGDDAVRIVVGTVTPDRFQPLDESRKVLRTAPHGDGDRIGTFLERLRRMIRLAYDEARGVPGCTLCGLPMALRTTKDKTRRFYGCTGYPACRGTRNA